jgi:RHH-type transcriptional regulator, rel operon repressor / antitoxin RelB
MDITATELPMSTMTLRLDDDLEVRLGKLADATRRSKSYLATEAIREYVVNHEWQLGEIHAAVAEARAGDFASDDDVAALARRWKPISKGTP